MQNKLNDFDYEKLPGINKKIDFLLKEIGLNFDCSPEKVSVLDVGCGNGGISFAIANRGYKVVGVDVDEASINFAKSNWELPNLKILITRGDLSEIEGQYDVAILSEVLEHLNNPVQLLQSIRKKLKNNSLLLVTVPNGYGPREVLGRLEKALRKNRKVDIVLDRVKKFFGILGFEEKRVLYTSSYSTEHVQKFTYHKIKKILQSSGFEIIKKVNSFFIFSIFLKMRKKYTFIEKFDCWIADFLPAFIVSGWYIACLFITLCEIYEDLPIA